MAATYVLTPTTGMVGGETVQFVEGHWLGEIGSGVAMTAEAFDVVAPILEAVAPGWTPMHRYGVFDVRPHIRRELASKFRRLAEELRGEPNAEGQAELLDELATWLERRLDDRPISVLGY